MENKNQDLINPEIDTEFDIKDLISFVQRNKNIILIITLASIISSFVYSKLKKASWQGQFQIVIQSPQDNQSAMKNSIKERLDVPLSLIDIGGNNELNTEVEILKSPSLLFNVYEEYKNKYKIQNINFNDWRRDNLKIRLIPKTSVLNITYEDTDKKAIIKVLENISKSYQVYSGRDRLKNVNNGLKYIKNQIAYYEKKSKLDLEEMYKYAIEKDLDLVTIDKNPKANTDISYLTIENERNLATNQVRSAEQQLKRLENIKSNDDAIAFYGKTIDELSKDNLSKKLDELDIELAIARASFTEKDKGVKELVDKRNFILKTLKRRTNAYLQAQKILALAKIEATTIPKEILIKYKGLIRQSFRNQETLNNLENQLNILALEKAKNKEPWQLITKPTILDKPVSLGGKAIILLGTLFGLTTGALCSYLIEIKKGLIYNSKEIMKELEVEKILELNFYEKEKWIDDILLICKNRININNNKIRIIPIGNITNDTKEILDKLNIINNRILIEDNDENISIIENSDELIILTAKGNVKKKEINKLKNRLNLVDLKTFGLILIQ
ncbi:GumC family protein [Prochlorococcus marinus]|uniref:Polysaccharide chain length determinant N-terminal domain-containing protein n=1 Tax=Prochlorococcus marinus XMU1408 TaxID=2213228 RepID=A0A318R636_PROMR|nr:Wzz/FepE/Etk N-terminal domain-containing protein [Prochlorococcus marinus]MBW3041843.1 hypothetical protein [Prochlorococcus marinus str. XMU1408]PYE02981.1 hypothetical protein DNJ73_04330 [Prochlorococcus marinus XMU1408]